MILIRTTFKAYLYRSVHNNCINHLKRKKYLQEKDEAFSNEILKQTEMQIRNLDDGIIENRMASGLRFTDFYMVAGVCIPSDEVGPEYGHSSESLN